MPEINDELYPSNSIEKKKEPEKKEIQKITTGKVSVRKPGVGKKLADTFLGDDVENVKTYLVMDVIVPAIKDTIVDMVCSGVEMIFGVRGRNRPASSRRNGGYTNYANISYKQNNRDERRNRDRDRRDDNTRYDANEIVLDSRSEAEDVIFALAELCDRYGMARVADLYELVGVTGDWQSQRWGWESVGSARAIRVRGGGYLIDLPKPIYLD